MRSTASPVLSALYRGDRERARALAEDRVLDLFEAAALGQAHRVQAALFEAPELASAVTDDGFTALHLNAFFSGDVQVARMLLDAGTDPNALAANETGLRPIHSAAAAGSHEVVALLIERGADVDAAQRGGYTPLHSAAANGNDGLVDLLIDAGADASRQTEDGRTAGALATQRGHVQTARRVEVLAASSGPRK